MDEAEVRDMRYLQRPALSVEALFKACANPANNGGYNCQPRSPHSSARDNPLYFDAYITLPMLGVETESTESTFGLRGNDGYVGGNSNIFVREINAGVLTISNVANNANIKVTVPLSMAIDSTESELFTDVACTSK